MTLLLWGAVVAAVGVVFVGLCSLSLKEFRKKRDLGCNFPHGKRRVNTWFRPL